MADSGYVVMPIKSDGTQHSGQMSSQHAANAAAAAEHSLRQSSGSQYDSKLRQNVTSSSQLDNNLRHDIAAQDPNANYLGTGSNMSHLHGAGNLRNDPAYRQQTMYDNHAGPLKKAFAHTDSLYKYLDWENPLRTVGSYFTAASFLLALHYFPLTQLTLKAAATVLGVVSVASFAGQSFNTNINGNPRAPRERRAYTTVPEATLNATLRDVHDFVQYAVVEAQRILFGEDASKTLAAFAVTTGLYWLIKILSPFGLALVGLTSVYIGTLIASPRGRAATREAGRRASDVTNAAAQRGKALARSSKKQAADMSTQASQAASSASQNISDSVSSGTRTAADSVSSGTKSAVNTVSSGTSSAADTVSSGTRNAADSISSGTKSAANTVSSGTSSAADTVSSGTRSASNSIGSSTRNTVTSLRQKLGLGGSSNTTQDTGSTTTRNTSDLSSTGVSSGMALGTPQSDLSSHRTVPTDTRQSGGVKSARIVDPSLGDTSNYTTSTILGEGDESYRTSGLHTNHTVPRTNVGMGQSTTNDETGYATIMEPYIGSSRNPSTATDNSMHTLRQGLDTNNPFLDSAGLGTTGGSTGETLSERKARELRAAKHAQGVSVGRTDI
ncbi:hypothetical protein LQW54_007173 [Pestalotiopsis sp. IQ-011]